MAFPVFLVCLAASTIGGICGIGGGVVIKPVLDSLGLMSVSAVSFLSGCTVLSMSLVSVYRNRKQLLQGGRMGTVLAIGAALGGIGGKTLFDLLRAVWKQDALIGFCQALILGLLTLGTLVYTLKTAAVRTHHVESLPVTALLGLGLGLVSSFLGIGGGPFNLVILHYCYSMEAKKAAKYSLYIVLLSQLASLSQTLALGRVPAFEPAMLLTMAGGGVLGGLLATSLNKRISSATTAKLFLAVLVIILLICLRNAVLFLG